MEGGKVGRWEGEELRRITNNQNNNDGGMNIE